MFSFEAADTDQSTRKIVRIQASAKHGILKEKLGKLELFHVVALLHLESV